MRGGSTHIRGALLGLLLERPGHGGELANRLHMRLGETWKVDNSDIYRLLEGLEKDELVKAREEPIPGKRLGTRVVYHSTERTPEALTVWIETLLPREPFRLGLQAKLAVARPEDVPRLRIALKEHKRECLTLVQMMKPSDSLPPSWPALFMDCTRDGVHRMLQAEIDWTDRTLTRIDEYGSQHP
jgi:DNA-binding PadR family transcriptional regulator